MNIMLMLFLSLIMGLIQINLWMLFPKCIKNIVFANPIFAFLINLAGSALIMSFTGTAQLVGSANLCASVIFACYAIYYKQRNKIIGLKVNWLRVLWIIPVFPIISAKTK